MPVLLNALVVGGELTMVMSPTFDLRIFWLNFGSVGLGEFIACFVIGLPLYRYLQSSGLAFVVLANNKLRYFVILSQQKQEGRGGAANTCNAW